jgi:DNA-binding NtrC family response regulator
MTSGKVLVLDDDPDACGLMEAALTGRGYTVRAETRARDALDAVGGTGDFDCVLTDLQLDDIDGLAVCERILGVRPDLPVIVVTGHASLEAAIAAMRAGAHDFVTKPIDLELLNLTVERAVQHHKLRAEVKRLRDEVDEARGFEKLLGQSTAMKRVFDVISRVSQTDATVLVTGESGTGKELVARAIHDRSQRRDGPFVAINCAAVPATLLESELFGHARGAFTDAKASRKGLFLEADGGTLFLDEIGEMPLEMQVKLLRALQERTVRAVGGNAEVPFNARVIAATNRDLETEIHDKRFREDLYYRINVVTVHVPPVREREGDVPLLAQKFVERFAARHSKNVIGISAPAAAKLVAYHWPGNVRELENSIERAVALTQFDHITVEDLPERIRAHRPDTMVMMPETAEELVTVEELERRYLLHVLKVVNGNKSRAARILGYDRRTLYRKLERMEAEGQATGTKRSSPPGEDRGSSVPPPGRSASAGSSGGGGDAHDSDDDYGRRSDPGAYASNGNHGNGRNGNDVRPSATASVLLVDDDADARDLLEILLAREGFSVRTAGSVADALAAGPVDIVVTDLALPDGSGVDVATGLPGTPAIALTGRDERAIEGVFRTSLMRPVPPDRLAAEIRRVLTS